MFSVCRTLRCTHFKLLKTRTKRQLIRTVTALYITGDKANKNYATLQPFMEFTKIYSERENLEYSIQKRGLQDRIDLAGVTKKYDMYKILKTQIEQLERKRDLVANKLRQLTEESGVTEDEIEALKVQGKKLRESQRRIRENLYPIEDDFVHAYLDLPNDIHPNCAIDGKEKIIYRNGLTAPQEGPSKSHLERIDLIRFANNDRYYLFEEAAKFDVFATQALASYFVQKGRFLPTSNPDFVRCVLLEANATPLEQYHRVIEQQFQDQLNYAYLAGGASFESYLAAVTRLCVYASVLPLRYVACGRVYEKVNSTPNDDVHSLFTATQSNAVQTFVATETAQEADEQFEDILNLTVDFYKSVGIPFRVIYEDASKLSSAESLRASIEVFSPNEQRYICVGRLSNYGDFVCKRILFCMRRKKDYHFLHLVGGPVLYTTRLIAALIENKLPFNHENLLGAYQPNEKPSAIEEFKELFK